jgi:hypothetical protein
MGDIKILILNLYTDFVDPPDDDYESNFFLNPRKGRKKKNQILPKYKMLTRQKNKRI